MLTECQGSVQTARANLRAMGLREVAAAAAAPPPPPSVPSFSSSRTAQPGPARRASTHYFTHYPTLNGCSGGSGGGGDAAPAANDAHTVDGRRFAGKVPPSVRADSSGTGPGYDVVPRRSRWAESYCDELGNLSDLSLIKYIDRMWRKNIFSL